MNEKGDLVNPFIKEIVGVVARALALYLAARYGMEVVSSDEISEVLSGVAVAGVLGWSIFQKFKSRQKLVTALAAPRKMTEDEVKETVASVWVTTPSVTTPSDTVPVVPKLEKKGGK